jgi:hypothetical protein
MSPALISFLLAAGTTLCLLIWALRPGRTVWRSTDEILEALSLSRHRSQLPQILRALQAEDFEYLQRAGVPELAAQVRRERRAAALEYVDCLEAEYELFLEAMRILAAMSSELMVLEEWQRFVALARFAVLCKLLRWKLRAGFSSRESFQLLSDVVSSAAMKVERATSKVAENALLSAEPANRLGYRGGSRK